MIDTIQGENNLNTPISGTNDDTRSPENITIVGNAVPLHAVTENNKSVCKLVTGEKLPDKSPPVES